MFLKMSNITYLDAIFGKINEFLVGSGPDPVIVIGPRTERQGE